MSRSILLEVNHPAQVHLFRYIYTELVARGNKVIVTTKHNTAIEYLLNCFAIPYTLIGYKKDNILSKAVMQLFHDFNTMRIVINEKIEIGIGSSITNDHVSLFTRMKSLHFSDDDEDIVPFITKYSYPFSDRIMAPDSLVFKKFPHKCISYAGTHELAYLHPNRFKPSKEVVNSVGLSEDEPYFVLRFVALKGHHDKGHMGISISQKRTLIELLRNYGKVFITSEKSIEPEFEKYRLPIPPENIHSFLFFAKMFFGDSQTMTSEAAILGTPALKCNTFAGRLSVPNELENRYGLCFSFQPNEFDDFMSKTNELLSMTDLNAVWHQRRQRFLLEKIDVTAFMVWFIENYPDSSFIMQESPDVQYNFH